jgi:hypothetical protein
MIILMSCGTKLNKRMLSRQQLNVSMIYQRIIVFGYFENTCEMSGQLQKHTYLQTTAARRQTKYQEK